MSKKRRTKKEKLLAELKRHSKTNVVEQTNTTFEFKLQNELAEKQEPVTPIIEEPNMSPIKAEGIKKYSYVLKDMKETLIITSLIIIMNFTFFTLLQNNIINLRFIGM